MFSFFKNKDVVIAELKAENLRLKDEMRKWEVIYKYDRAIDRVIHFPNADMFVKYLKLKAENNIKMSDFFGEYSETITPKELDTELLSIKKQIRLFECELRASVEKSFMVIQKDGVKGE